MNNQDQLPTIAELWEELQSYVDFFTRHTLSGNPHDLGEMKSLRQQLLERTETEWGIQIRKIISDGIPALRVVFDHGVLFLDSANSKELGACIQFGSWELEQREKERKGD